jgi:Domain of unknown function (DUF4258)
VDLQFSPHALARMAQRGIDRDDVERIVRSGPCAPDVNTAGGEPRWRYTGTTANGRIVTVITAGPHWRGTVVTAF